MLLFLYSLFLTRNLLGVSSTGASPINPSYKGTGLMASHLKRAGYKVKIAVRPDPRLLGEGGVLMIISPESNFTPTDLSFIQKAYLRDYSLIVADEGPYSNTLFNYLKIPIKIITSPYFLRNHFPNARIELGGKEYSLGLAYAAALKISEIIEPAGWCNNEVVMGIYRVDGKVKIFALSDGSVFTNAALTPLTTFNPYVRFLNSIVKIADEGRPKEVIIFASPYPERAMSIEDMITAGYSPVEVWAALINPFRTGVSIIQFLSKPSPISALIYGILLLTASLIIRSSLKLPIYATPSISALRRYWNERHLVKALCAEGRNFLSPEKCRKLSRIKKDEDVIKELNNYISSRPELISRIIEFFSPH